MTVRQAAQRCKTLGGNTITLIDSGVMENPSIETVVLLSEALSCTVAHLIVLDEVTPYWRCCDVPPAMRAPVRPVQLQIKRIVERMAGGHTRYWAQRGGMSVAYLNALCRGAYPNPRVKTIAHLSYALGVVPDYLCVAQHTEPGPVCWGCGAPMKKELDVPSDRM